MGLGWPRAKYVRSHCMALASPLITSPTRAPRLARTTTSTFSTVSLQRGGGAAVNRPRAPTPLLCQQALGCAPVLIFYFFMYWSAPPVLPGPDHFLSCHGSIVFLLSTLCCPLPSHRVYISTHHIGVALRDHSPFHSRSASRAPQSPEENAA